MAMGDFGHRFNIKDVQLRVADDLAIDRLGPLRQGFPKIFRLRRINEDNLDPQLGEGVVKQVVGPPVQSGR